MGSSPRRNHEGNPVMSGVSDISPEVVERMVALVRDVADGEPVYRNELAATWEVEARAIAALLPEPIDPDLIEARKIGAEIARRSGNDIQQILRPDCWESGVNDDTHKMQLMLAAIKRGRELAAQP